MFGQRFQFSHAGRLLLVAVLLSGSCKKAPINPPEVVGHLSRNDMTEVSGLAASRRSPDLLWAHNDSSGQPVLYAIGFDGTSRGSIRVAGTKNIDWEDVSSFTLDGKFWLLIADTGDNGGIRKNCSFLIVEEPDPLTLSPDRETPATVAWRIPFTYPDAPHDCEAAAVDPREKKIYFITKRTTPPVLYSLPLLPTDDVRGPLPEIAQASFVLRLKGLPQPDTRQKALPTPGGHFRAQVTAMDMASDQRTAAVLTYGEVLLFQRKENESWANAFNRPPQRFAPHNLAQAEAVAFSQDNRAVYVTGERKAPILRYSLKPSPSK